jgi:hypothetical protein
MKRRIFTSLAATAAVAASILISSGAAEAAPDSATAATPQSTSTTTDPGSATAAAAVAVDTATYRIVVTLHGVGKQVYDCKNGVYALREPMAGLFTSRGIPAGIHGATTGPTAPFWANFDGSRVVGNTTNDLTTNPTFVAVNAPNFARDVKWLKVPAASNAGTGVFSNVAFIQRINTRGGVAPATCGAPTISLDYATDYVFWAKK